MDLELSTLLVGEPGVGKTGLVEGFAQRVHGGGLPEELRGTRVIENSLTAIRKHPRPELQR